MLNAYNNDIEYKSRWYHIQTEDNGTTIGNITTTVFHSGQTLDVKTTSYLDAIKGVTETDAVNAIIKEKMTEQHGIFYRKLFNGDYDAKVAAIHNKSGQASKVSGLSMPRVSSSSVAPARRSIPTINPPKSTLSQPIISTGKQDGGVSPLSASRKSSVILSNVSDRAAHPAKPIERSKAVIQASQRQVSRPWCGVQWPQNDLALDTLVATLLSGQTA